MAAQSNNSESKNQMTDLKEIIDVLVEARLKTEHKSAMKKWYEKNKAERKFICPYCGRAFCSNQSLNSHMLVSKAHRIPDAPPL